MAKAVTCTGTPAGTIGGNLSTSCVATVAVCEDGGACGMPHNAADAESTFGEMPGATLSSDRSSNGSIDNRLFLFFIITRLLIYQKMPADPCPLFV
jgi:hypothetical protein